MSELDVGRSRATTDPIRVGIIGVGWGNAVLIPAFRAVPEFEVVALCSRRQERVDAAAARWDIAGTSTDWPTFVQRDDLDLIAVCTPTVLHHDQTIAAFEAGKHVLCEKPVALDEAQTRRMLAAAQTAGKAHAVSFEGRWLRERLAVWELVREGFLGDAYLARATNTADYWHPSRSLQSEWMYRVDQGGGYLAGMSTHDIDYLCALFGEPAAVCADVRTTVPTRERPDGTELTVDADDTSTLLLRMKSGVTATVSTTTVAAHVSTRTFEAYGSAGSLRISGPVQGPDSDTVILAGRVSEPALAPVPQADREPRSGVAIPNRRAGSAIRSLALMLEEWLPAFDGKPTPTVPSLYDGLTVQRVVDAARHSSAGAGWVELN